MTTTSPNRIDELLQFGRQHKPVFSSQAANLVLPATATAYGTALDAFDAAVTAAAKARLDAKRATDA
ncbi:MAG: hypothetical protein K2Q09_05140 [Phycisphaerales bacterium]|nr:hypothetical protein [Phycisphaerales bacterium]